MEITKHYNNLAERQKIIAEWESKKYRMLHDDFDMDYIIGKGEPHGTMTFTDVMPPVIIPEPVRDLVTEIDEMKARIGALEKK